MKKGSFGEMVQFGVGEQIVKKSNKRPSGRLREDTTI
jgi:hypothetical protein